MPENMSKYDKMLEELVEEFPMVAEEVEELQGAMEESMLEGDELADDEEMLDEEMGMEEEGPELEMEDEEEGLADEEDEELF